MKQLYRKEDFNMRVTNREEFKTWRKQSELKSQKIYNMDCLEGLNMIPDKSVDVVISDPPYELELKGENTGAAKDAEFLNEIEFMSNGFNKQVLDECMRVLRDIKAFFFCSKNQIPMYIEYFADKNVELQLLTWNKTNCCPFLCNNKYLNSTEYIIYVCEKDIADSVHLVTDHYITPKVHVKKDSGLYHPTMKYTNQLADMIQAVTKVGDIVLDPFMGSGSTAVACIETERRYIGFEIDEKYFNICNKRIDLALAEHPEYNLSSDYLGMLLDIPYTPTTFTLFEDCSIDMAYFDICEKDSDIPYELFEKVIEKQKKPNFYIMTTMKQFSEVLMYFKKQDYQFDIIGNFQSDGTKYLLFFRKGGVKLYGSYATKKKYYEDDRDMALPYQDTISYELMRRIVVNSSLEGDTVFCYGGYGTSIKVCQDEGRHFIAYEHDMAKIPFCLDAIRCENIPSHDQYTGQLG